MTPRIKEAEKLLSQYSLFDKKLFVIGAFDTGVTVLSQQVRALNLVWALVESKTLATSQARVSLSNKPRVAIVGAGFAGMTFAAALLKKGLDAHVTLFERRDTLLPLQQGSDSRWLHPNIYDWPSIQSEVSSASLPVLNWTAGRASDVVVQVMREWESEVQKSAVHGQQIELFCNSQHLQVQEEPMSSKLRIEWVGEQRQAKDGIEPMDATSRAKGCSELFDLVVLAIGFGLEADSAHSYWRNETLSQPHLDEPQLTYVVSGQGDGAMIDLLRLRVSQFRQDRILSELFSASENGPTVDSLRVLAKEDAENSAETFGRLETIFSTSPGAEVLTLLGRRLRQDTRVLLHLRKKRFSELFSDSKIRMSFQNKVLTYLLYKCGGFSPVTGELRLR